jgi:hypothetical protein
MMTTTKKLIGGQKLRELGSDRYTDDTDYLIHDESDDRLFIHETGVDMINSAAHPFYTAVWMLDAESDDVSLRAMFEMTVFTFVQHCENFQFEKADKKEYDLKFLVRKIGLENIDYSIAKKYISAGGITEIEKIIKSVKI